MGKTILISANAAYVFNNIGKVTFSDYNNGLTITAQENLTLSFSNDLEYRDGVSILWKPLQANTLLTIENGNSIILKGKLLPTNNGIGTFTVSGDFTVSGNILSLIDNGTMKNYSFKNLFKNCTTLTNVSKLELPDYVTQNCYEGMFYGCTSIEESPILSAETLQNNCYTDMFYGCSSLSYITCKNISDISQYVNTNWVYGVASEGTFEINDSGNWNNTNKASHIPANWTIDDGDYSEKYLTFKILTNGTILWKGFGTNAAYNALTVSYSKDNGTTWTDITATSEGVEINVVSGDKVLIKGNNTRYSYDYQNYCGFVAGTATYNIEGNIMSLIYGDNFVNQLTLTTTYALAHIFSDSNIVSAENLVMPATTLSNSCYRGIFDRCSLLVKSPKILPAVNLKEYCYYWMFESCSSLITTPSLPATSLAQYCYSNMFQNCTSLTTAPSLPATTLVNNCYESMFYGCTSLTTTPSLPATTLVNNCYYQMFYGCTSLTTAPSLPATTLATNCYYNMLKNCTSLTTAPSLPATTLTNSCYYGMFSGCTSLTTAPSLPATTLAVACYYAMFGGCTSLTTAPDLLVDKLYSTCYYHMFYGCTSLNYIKCMYNKFDFSVTNENDCVYQMLYNVSPTGTLVKEINTDWSSNNSSVPSGWTITNEGVIKPTISFDDNKITLGCQTSGATIYYQLNNTDNYIAYTGIIEISSDTMIFAYAELNGVTSTTSFMNCTYINTTLVDPVISFNYGTTITISCDTTNSTIYYRLNNTGSFIQYTEPIIINATTFIEAYSELNGSTSNTVSETFTFINYNEVYFTIESLEDSNTISIVKTKTPNNINLSYSTNDGETWTDLTISATTTFTTINTGDKIIFKGINNRLAIAWDTYYRFNGTKNFKAYGNVMSLLNGDNFVNTFELNSSTDNHFVGLFYGTTTLIDADKLVLSAPTLYYNSYNGMFRGCTNLKYAPKLQATTAGQECCSSMFEGCINLETVPEINFTTLAQSCCKRMFCMNRSSKITTPKMTKSPILRCTTTASSCYEEMFKGNGNLIEVTCLKTDNTNACANWLVNCSSVGTFKKNQNASWSTGTSGIPSGWTVENYVEE